MFYMDTKVETDQKAQKKIIEGHIDESGANKEVSNNGLEEKSKETAKKRVKKIKYPTWESRTRKRKLAQKKKIDFNKPLPNPKHELLARKLASGANKKVAYKELYNTNVSQPNHKVVNHPNIQARYIALLEQNPSTSTQAIAQKMAKLIDAKRAVTLNDSIVYVDDNSTQLETVKTILKVQGVTDKGQDIPQIAQVNNADISQLSTIIDRLDNMARQLKVSPIPDIVDIT